MPAADQHKPSNSSSVNSILNSVGLRCFSKLTCFSTLFLIFVGGMVTSTQSGLAVPDWPLSYGTLFPPMVGGVFYEHGHRMVAATVGFFMLILSVWIAIVEQRKWLKVLGFAALSTVIIQGILGGITVLYFLPTPVSVLHGIIAQSFFILTIIITYSLSAERVTRSSRDESTETRFLKVTLLVIFLVFLQLVVGAIMRHTQSGLAIPDFPKMGGAWIPRFDESMLTYINQWRFENNFDAILMGQVLIHFCHRVGAIIVSGGTLYLVYIGFLKYHHRPVILKTILFLLILLVLQVNLGIATVVSMKQSVLTSLHVVTGASILGVSTLLFLRVSPLTIRELRQRLS